MEVFRTYNTQATIYFPLLQVGSSLRQPTWTPAASETQRSLDGGAFANSTNTPAHEGNGIWSLILTASEMQADVIVVTLSDSETDIQDQTIIVNTTLGGQIEASQGIIIGEVDTATFTATTTSLEGFRISPDLTEEATADHYNGRLLLFTSGALTGQQTDITDYELANSKEKFTYTALTEAPADADRYVVL